MIRQLTTFLEAIKFSHSVFALPFALVAMLVAAEGIPSAWTIFWIVIACVCARTAAMSFNRLADVEFDAHNPRTKNRALVTGALSRNFVINALIGSTLGFFLAAALLNRLCLYLAPPTLGVLLLYSLTKRVTNLAHFVLGLALGLAPMGAWVAVTGHINVLPMVLAAAVICWVAGFDILYACQDYENDRDDSRLHSIPKALGVTRAMRVARRAHGVAFGLFLLFWWFAAPLGWLTLLGVLGIGWMLRRQHQLVSPKDLSKLDAAFFTANGIIAVGFFAVVLVDVAVW